VSENFEGVSGRKLQNLLKKIKPFREQFWLELRGNLEEVNNFAQEDTTAFYTVNDYGYLLGKFESMMLPVFDNKSKFMVDIEVEPVEMMFISEIYTKPDFRNHGVANFMIRNTQLSAGGKNLPLVLGCRNELVSYFERFSFLPIENFKSEACAFMFWSYSPTIIQQQFELLFK